MCQGTREDGSEIAPNDPNWDALMVAAVAAKSDPIAWIAQEQFYGDLAQNDRFAKSFAGWMKHIESEGVEATLIAYAG